MLNDTSIRKITRNFCETRFYFSSIPIPTFNATQKITVKITSIYLLRSLRNLSYQCNDLMDLWLRQISFKDIADRRIQLVRFINFYNTVKPHKGLNNARPYEILTAYFNQSLCKQP